MTSHISRERVCLMDLYIITFHNCIMPPPPMKLSQMFSKELFHSPITSMWESEQMENWWAKTWDNSPYNHTVNSRGAWVWPPVTRWLLFLPLCPYLTSASHPCSQVKGNTEGLAKIDTSSRLSYLLFFFFMMPGVSGKLTGNMTCTCHCSCTSDEKDAVKLNKATCPRERNPLTEEGLSQSRGHYELHCKTLQKKNTWRLYSATERKYFFSF